MMADVSGYTALSERYNKSGKGGTYRLTVTLNTYLGSLIELIYSYGGDIIKFAGDAFLACWKTDKRTFLCHTIHTAIACALLIQHLYARYETDVKVNLKVKLAISAGNLMFAPIGTGIDMNYVIFGLPVIEAKLAESLCISGQVKLTPTAWAHCYSRNYDYDLHDDGHVTIRSILYDPHEKDVSKPFLGFSSMIRQIKKSNGGIENLPDFLWDSPKNLGVKDTLRKSESLSLRRAILIAEERDIGSEIRKFMIRPVLTQIDAHQPLEYLTEMRQVSVVFITLKPRECPPPQLITIVNNSYQITCEIVYKSMGCVNKIILFDKDVMILVIFGLRGFKHESEAQAALKCACSIKKSVASLDGVLDVSIGVTTGQVYCGVVGHPLRREFTVIGAVVNKAARLMCSFRNKISCDEATFVKSKMSTNGFTLQPNIELKGIGEPGKIYEYTEEIRVKELYDIPMIPPLLDRTDEMEYFGNWLDDSHLSYRDFDALLLVGESRIGKTRLLEWMERHCRNRGYHVCRINLTSIHSANPYLALTQIINQMLHLKEPVTGFIKEEKIVETLKAYNEDLCYLNNILKVRFAYHEGIYSQDEHKRQEKAKYMFAKLIMSISETHIIFLDDIQNLDIHSWEFISIMFNAKRFFSVMSVTRSKFSSVHKWLYSVLINNSIRKIVLGPLSPDWIPPLACQILDVDAVPNDLCNALRIKCKGMPGLVESFIVHLFSTGAIEIKKVNSNELEEWKSEDLQFPDSEQLRPQALDVNNQRTLDEMIEQESTGQINICIVTQKEELKTNINVQNLDALIMVQIDSLTPYQQLLLKIASVIGNVLSRDLLENIMYENNPMTTAKAVKRLFAMRIFSCANSSARTRHIVSHLTMSSINSIDQANLVCDCSFVHDPESNENLPKYAFCKVMKFRNKNSRKTCYELLPINQKKEFHSRIVHYLEHNKQKCPNCGGTLIVVQSIMALPVEDNTESATMSMSNISPSESDSNLSLNQNEKEHSSIVNANLDYVRKATSEKFSRPGNYTELHRTASQHSSLGMSAERNHWQNAPILKKASEEFLMSRMSSKRVTIPNLLLKESTDEDEEFKVYDKLRPIVEASKISDWHDLGIVDSEDEITDKTTFCIKIEKSTSRIDFKKCTCVELNIIIFEQLIDHAQKAEMKSKAVEFIIQLCYYNLLTNNIEAAIVNLQEAELKCLEKHTQENAITTFDKRRFLGKIYSFRSAAYLLSGKPSAAKLELERATRIYNLKLLNVTNLLGLKNLLNLNKLKRRKYRDSEKILTADSIFCLNVATILYSTIGDDKASRMSATRALELVQVTECNVTDICDALGNALQVELDRGCAEATANIERISNRVLRNLPRPVQPNELHSLGKVFLITFRARVARAELSSSIHSGFRAITISNFLNANSVSLEIIPDLFYVLLCRRHIAEAIDILHLALRIGQNQVSKVYETWYYALSMDLILDAGLQLESPKEIDRFSEYALHMSVGPSRRRLVVNLWTYWMRADFEKKAKRFETEALSWAGRVGEDDGSLATLISSLRLAEGMLESLARKMDDLRKVTRVNINSEH